jgi:F420H(2)-dependent quinone reductase
VSGYAQALRLHQALYERTDGRIGHRLLGVPTLLLRTVGRRTGAPRTNALVYAPEDGAYLVVPSNGGAERPPGWFFNLERNPAVEIQIGRDRKAARAEVVTHDDPDFERLWRIADENNRGRYSAYQRECSRRIPVVALRPAGAGSV